MKKIFRVTIQDVVEAENFKEALVAVLEIMNSEETMASVEEEETGEIQHFETRSLERIDFEEEEVIIKIGGPHG